MNYNVAHLIAMLNAVVGVVAGALSAAYLVAHPSWLTQDIALTCGIIVTITVGLAALLPSVTRTPAARETKYLAAMAGSLPDDLEKKHRRKATRPFDTFIPPAA